MKTPREVKILENVFKASVSQKLPLPHSQSCTCANWKLIQSPDFHLGAVICEFSLCWCHWTWTCLLLLFSAGDGYVCLRRQTSVGWDHLHHLAETKAGTLPASFFLAMLSQLCCYKLACSVLGLLLCVAKSLFKQFLLKVILSWMISLNLLGAVFIGSRKRGGAVTISVCFLLANAVFWCFFKPLFCPFSIWKWWQSLCTLVRCQIGSAGYCPSTSSIFPPNDLRKGVNPSMHLTRHDLNPPEASMQLEHRWGGLSLVCLSKALPMGPCLPSQVGTELCPCQCALTLPAVFCNYKGAELLWAAGNLLTLL